MTPVSLGPLVFQTITNTTVDGINLALSITENMPEFPWSNVLKVMQDVYHQ